MDSRFITMLGLAHKRTDEARIELAGMLADLHNDGEDQLTLRQQEIVHELIDLLVSSNQSAALRLALVERFADTVHMPRKIACALATSPIEMAGKILSTNANFVDDDLISIVATQSRDHAAAVAQRQAISEAVADALVVTGDVKIMQLVAENLGARLTPKSLDIIAGAARFTAPLREPVMKRPEMTADKAARLYWWVSQDLRRYAMKRFGITSGQIDSSLLHTVEELLSYHRLDKDDESIMEQIADWLDDRQAVNTRILPQILRLGHFRLFTILMARMARLDSSLIEGIVSENGGRSLAVVCRALGIDKAGFISIFLLSRGSRAGEQVVHPRELSFALAAFDKLSTNLAHDLLHTWRQNPAFLLNRQQNELALEA